MARVVPSQVVKLIDDLYPWASRNGSKILRFDESAALSGLLSMTDQIPSELLVVDGEKYNGFVVGISAIRISVRIWEKPDQWARNHSVVQVRGFGVLHPIVLIRQALASCPDEFPAVGTAELSFISEKDLRESLRIDISAVNGALSNGEWKAATILAGSVIEALLLWALQQDKKSDVTSAVQKLVRSNIFKNPGTNLGKWGLHEFIEVAAELSAVETDTATLARLARNYRNLIHPGKAQRLGQVCDRGTALAAVAALEHVVRDLSP